MKRPPLRVYLVVCEDGVVMNPSEGFDRDAARADAEALARALEQIAVGGDEREPGASMAEVARRALARYRGEGEVAT